MVFSVGDKVVYPIYGAGVIEDLAVKLIDGVEQTYYVLKMPLGNLTIMISTKNASNLGIRHIIPAGEMVDIIRSVRSVPISMSENWNQRYSDNMEKIKTGNLMQVSEVFRNLRIRERERGLSSAEKKMLSTVRQIIVSELILSNNVAKDEAESILDQAVIG